MGHANYKIEGSDSENKSITLNKDLNKSPRKEKFATLILEPINNDGPSESAGGVGKDEVSPDTFNKQKSRAYLPYGEKSGSPTFDDFLTPCEEPLEEIGAIKKPATKLKLT